MVEDSEAKTTSTIKGIWVKLSSQVPGVHRHELIKFCFARAICCIKGRQLYADTVGGTLQHYVILSILQIKQCGIFDSRCVQLISDLNCITHEKIVVDQFK